MDGTSVGGVMACVAAMRRATVSSSSPPTERRVNAGRRHRPLPAFTCRSGSRRHRPSDRHAGAVSSRDALTSRSAGTPMPLRQRRPRVLAPLLALGALAVSASAALGQECAEVASQTSLAALTGRRIAAVRVVTADPEPLPGPAGVLSGLHVRTRESTVRRDLLLVPGDTVDTLKVAESLRRLRQ